MTNRMFEGDRKEFTPLDPPTWILKKLLSNVKSVTINTE
jgi:hypothetical protein